MIKRYYNSRQLALIITNYNNLLFHLTIAWLLQLTTGITIYDDCSYNLRHALQLTTLLQFTTDTLLWSVHLCPQSSISRANGNRPAFTDWEPRGRLCEKWFATKKFNSPFWTKVWSPLIKNSWIRLWFFFLLLLLHIFFHFFSLCFLHIIILYWINLAPHY